MSESMNFSVLKHHPSTYGPQLRAKVHSLQKLEFEVLLRNPSSPKNQNTITATSTTQHQAITHSSSKHHSTITTHHGDFTEYARDATNTSLKGPQNTIKKPNKQNQNNPETSPKKNRDRDMTETSQRHRQNNTETRQRQDQERTETRPRHHGDKEASSVDIRATATLVCPKVHNIQIQIRI